MALAHTIEAQPIPNRYARGWHCLGLAADYKDGKPHKLDIFGTNLVAFEGENGQVSILDGHCPHMGADLSTGEIIGNTVQCPFHHWRWSAEGKCVEIPYCKRIPPKARVRTWPVCEQNQLLFVYNDPEGNPPPPELAIPRIEACFSESRVSSGKSMSHPALPIVVTPSGFNGYWFSSTFPGRMRMSQAPASSTLRFGSMLATGGPGLSTGAGTWIATRSGGGMILEST